ncbi:hypothetical protein GMST_10720 [Geomonas silvestris]|uniref:HD-GYP domain-containing protein n=1 Tax=Geomonas silvestris TaxID=2740184 RepID=A0A6V8MFK4_9BACT|nr:HD domain-containing phosphohydrolase [Geomonas silvestris]GFO58747.1 hypothetical protein GMST_10720 [Geomonas silvestris]
MGKIGIPSSHRHAQRYSQAIAAIRVVFLETEAGRVPETAALLAAARDLAAAARRDPVPLLGLSLSKDYDSYSFHHSVNVAVLAMALAASMGLPQEEVEEIGLAGFLHDIGKTRIDRSIVLKPGKLTRAEYQEMQRHPEYGAAIGAELPGVSQRVAEAVLAHHVRFDRTGYPDWACGREYGRISSIVAVADCYDAATTMRLYQEQLQPMQAVQEIRRQAGSALDGAIVERFLALVGRYPVGSLVRLEGNEIAVVFTPSSHPAGAAVVKVVRDSAGVPLAEPRLLTLVEGGTRIVDLVDPLQQGIDVSDCF